MLINIITAVCLLAIVILFLTMPAESTLQQRTPFFGLSCAHRGLHSKDKSVPENSMAAFTAAIDAGYGIELDIRLSKDEQVVVFHDDTLKRLCAENKKVNSCTYEELQEFNILASKQKIPRLKDVLNLVNGQVPLIIELKPSASSNVKLCEAAWKILRLYDGDICIESFEPRILRWFKKNVPGLLRGQLSGTMKTLGKNVQAFVVANGFAHVLSRPHFIAFEAKPKPIFMKFASKFAMNVVWTARPPMDVEKLQAENDAVIFEFYEPDTYYKSLPKRGRMRYTDVLENNGEDFVLVETEKEAKPKKRKTDQKKKETDAQKELANKKDKTDIDSL